MVGEFKTARGHSGSTVCRTVCPLTIAGAVAGLKKALHWIYGEGCQHHCKSVPNSGGARPLNIRGGGKQRSLCLPCCFIEPAYPRCPKLRTNDGLTYAHSLPLRSLMLPWWSEMPPRMRTPSNWAMDGIVPRLGGLNA